MWNVDNIPELKSLFSKRALLARVRTLKPMEGCMAER